MGTHLRKASLRGLLIGLSVVGAAVAEAPRATEDPKASHTVSEVTVIAHRAPTVEELTVVARAKCLPPKPHFKSDRPKIVSTYPRRDEVVRPGLMILRLTFDQPMSCSGFVAVSPGRKNPCDNSEQHFLMSFDHKTVRIVCVVEPGVRYVLYLNGTVDTPDGAFNPPRFVSLDNQVLDSSSLAFSASAAAPVDTILAALTADPQTVLPEVYRPLQKAAAPTPHP
jgi:hypothetical protein